LNATNSTTRISLTGPATVVAHFLVDLEFYVEPPGAGGILVNATRVPLGALALYPTGTYAIEALGAPGWRLSSLATSGSGVEIVDGLLSANTSGWIAADFTAYPSLVISTSDPACGPVSFANISEPNGTLVGTDLGSFPIAAPSCTDGLFEKWQTSGGVNVSAPTRPTTTITVTGNGTLEALFLRTAWIQVEVEPSAAAGYINWNGSRFDNGSLAAQPLGRYPIEAVAAPGWAFVRWQTAGGVAEEASLAVLSSNGTLIAEFENTTTMPPTKGGGGAGAYLGLTSDEWVIAVGGGIAAVAIVAALLRRRGRPRPGEEAPGEADPGKDVEPASAWEGQG
jgi:hypothetical protein